MGDKSTINLYWYIFWSSISIPHSWLLNMQPKLVFNISLHSPIMSSSVDSVGGKTCVSSWISFCCLSSSLIRSMLLDIMMMLNKTFTMSLDYNTGQNIVGRENKSIFLVSVHWNQIAALSIMKRKTIRRFRGNWCHIRESAQTFAANKYVIRQVLSYLFQLWIQKLGE